VNDEQILTWAEHWHFPQLVADGYVVRAGHSSWLNAMCVCAKVEKEAVIMRIEQWNTLVDPASMQGAQNG